MLHSTNRVQKASNASKNDQCKIPATDLQNGPLPTRGLQDCHSAVALSEGVRDESGGAQEEERGGAQEEERTQEDTSGVPPYRDHVDTEAAGHSSRIEDILTFQHHDRCQIGSVLVAGTGSSTAWQGVVLEVANLRVVHESLV